MGDMADFALDDVCEFENLRDLYANSSMTQEEAFDAGFLDPTGAWTGFEGPNFEDRIDVLSYESLTDTIEHIDQCSFGPRVTVRECQVSPWLKQQRETYPHLNDKAIYNLAKDVPTCNVCEEAMKQRSGRFGDFYYCANSCKGQKTVSEKYWDSVRIKK